MITLRQSKATKETEMQDVRIFLAAPETAQKEDMSALTDFVRAINLTCEVDGGRFRLVRVEKSFSPIDYGERDVLLALYYGTVDGMVSAYLDGALKSFTDGKKPRIVVGIKQEKRVRLPFDVRALTERLDYMQGAFYSCFDSANGLCFSLLMALCSIEQTLLAECRDGVVTVEGERLVSFDGVPLADKSRELISLRKEYSEVSDSFFSAREVYEAREGEQDAAFAYYEASRRRIEVRRELFSLENALLNAALNMARDIAAGELSDRRRSAYRLFYKGDLKSANGALSLETIKNEIAGASIDPDEVVGELLQKARLLLARGQSYEGLCEIDECFAEAIKLEEKRKLTKRATDALVGYRLKKGDDKAVVELAIKLENDERYAAKAFVLQAEGYLSLGDDLRAEKSARKLDTISSPSAEYCVRGKLVLLDISVERSSFDTAQELCDEIEKLLLDIASGEERARWEALFALKRAELMEKLARFDEAQAGYTDALSRVLTLSWEKPDENFSLLVKTYCSFGRFYNGTFRYALGAELLEKARELVMPFVYDGGEGEYSSLYAKICRELGQAYCALHLFDAAKLRLFEARDIFEAAFKSSRKAGAFDYIDALNVTAEYCYTVSDVSFFEYSEKAFELSNKYLIGEDEKNRTLKIRINLNRALSLEANGKMDEALTLYSEAVSSTQEPCRINERAYMRLLDEAKTARAKYFLRCKRNADAIVDLESLLSRYDRAFREEDASSLIVRRVELLSILGGVYRGERNYLKARELCESAQSLLREYPDKVKLIRKGEGDISTFETALWTLVFEGLFDINSDEGEDTAANWYISRAIELQKQLVRLGYADCEKRRLVELYLKKALFSPNVAERESQINLALETALSCEPDDRESRLELVRVYNEYGAFLSSRERFPEAYSAIETGIKLVGQLSKKADAKALERLAELYKSLAEARRADGDYDGAVNEYINMYESIDEKSYLRSIAARNAGDILSLLGEEEKAEKFFGAAKAVLDAQDKDNLEVLEERTEYLLSMSAHRFNFGNEKEAKQYRRRATSSARKLLAKAPKPKKDYYEHFFDLLRYPDFPKDNK